MALRIEQVAIGHIDDLETLFGSDEKAGRCWCMWFLIKVADFHAARGDGNREAFQRLVDAEPHPMGLIAYLDDHPVGWCAVGPRARYARAVKALTLRNREGGDDDVWFVPCFFIHPDHRGAGIASALLDSAVAHAFAAGAVAVEGFPLAGDRRRSSGSDFQTGVEPLFAAADFAPHHRPSQNRVVMRRDCP